MNQEQGKRGVPRAPQYGSVPSQGSVRRAREMAEAGMTQSRGPSSIPVRGQASTLGPRAVVTTNSNDQSRQGNAARRQALPTALGNARSKPNAVGLAISKPAPMAQWSLQDDPARNIADTSSDAIGKGPAPQRPQRPSNVPSLLDSSKIREYTPSIPYKQQQQQQQIQAPRPSPRSGSTDWDDDEQSPSIPDFPIPMAPPPIPTMQRKIGPPPSSRRGPSSHYSTASHVSPIPEERDSKRNTPGSFASSHVIPASWGSQTPDTMTPDDDYDDEYNAASNDATYENDSVGLVRQASIGQRHKPELRTIKSYDDSSGGGNRGPKIDKSKVQKGGVVAQAAVAAGAGAGAIAAGFGSSRYDMPPVQTLPPPNRTVFLDASASSSPPMAAEIDCDRDKDSVRSKSPLNPPIDPRVAQLNGGFEKRVESTAGIPAMSDKIPGSRRPPRLNMDAVKEAEARGSLTSLPDLIRRATRLATNLDRGRTASRMGILDLFKDDMDPEKDSQRAQRRSGSISDILASFPPPGLATPTGDRPDSRSRYQNSPSRLAYGGIPDDSRRSEHSSDVPRDRRRRCCGMPLWAFLLVLIVLLLLIAAAVVVPVTLIVIPRQQEANEDHRTDTCESSSKCANGGVSVLSGGRCQCVCVAGFTGETCTIPGDLGCTTTDIANGTSSFKNATVGRSIPRLLQGSETNYSIPLNSSTILTLFNSNNLSCASENALVMFNGKAQKRFIPLLEIEAEANHRFSNPTPTSGGVVHNLLFPRQDNPVATSNGVVFAPSSTGAAVSSTPTSSSSSSSNSTSDSDDDNNSDSGNDNNNDDNSDSDSGSSPTSTNTNVTAVFVDEQTTDFARIVILFVLQRTGNLSAAVSTQERIQSFFTEPDVNAMRGYETGLDLTIDFQTFSITLGNGTTIGGRGPSPSATAQPLRGPSSTAGSNQKRRVWDR